MTDAILGTTATLPALDGDVDVEIQPGTQSAEIITVKDRGVTQPARHRPRRPEDRRPGGHPDASSTARSATSSSSSRRRSRRPAPPSSRTSSRACSRKLRDRFLELVAVAAMAHLYLDESLDLLDVGARRASSSSRATRPGTRSPSRRMRVGRAAARSATDAAWSCAARSPRRMPSGSRSRSTRCVDEARPSPQHLARAGARQGRPRRTRGAGRDRTRRRRRHPVGGRALGRRAGRAPKAAKGRERWASDRARGEQAVDPGVAARGRPLATTAELRRSPAGVGCSCSSPTADAPLTDRRSPTGATSRSSSARRAASRPPSSSARRGRGRTGAARAEPCCAPRRRAPRRSPC